MKSLHSIVKKITDEAVGEYKKQMEKQKDCSVCGNKIDVHINGWTDGHNAEPVNKGRCCSNCNSTVVLPARINEMQQIMQRGNKND